MKWRDISFEYPSTYHVYYKEFLSLITFKYGRGEGEDKFTKLIKKLNVLINYKAATLNRGN